MPRRHRLQILAKLAMGTHDMFKAALDGARSTLDKKWQAKIELQVMCFLAAAHYWQSIVEKEAAAESGSGYGIEVRRLSVAEGKVRCAVGV